VQWGKLQTETLWKLANASVKDTKPDRSYAFLCEDYSLERGSSEFTTYGPCPNIKCSRESSCPKCNGKNRFKFEDNAELHGTQQFDSDFNHTYLDLCNPKGKPVCRVVNVHMPSKSPTPVDNLVNFINTYKDNEDGIPVIFGGDSNVYYGGKKGLKQISDLQERLAKKGLEYTLVIAKHLVRKVRTPNFFLNAQAAYKNGGTTQETMFFAFPKDLKGGKVEHTFDDVLDGKKERNCMCVRGSRPHG